MRSISDIIKVGDVYNIVYSGMRSDLVELPFFIKEIGTDFIHIETFCEETELDVTEFESDETLEDYIESNMDLLSESSILVKEEFLVMKDKIGSFVPVNDSETVEFLRKNKERYESSMLIKKMYEKPEE